MRNILFVFACVCVVANGVAQEVRLESLVGINGVGVDAFWVEPFGPKSHFLYTSRNTFRTNGYTTQPRSFSTLNIASYQIKKSGFGIAALAVADSHSPIQARLGIQFFRVKRGKFLLNSIVSSKVGAQPDGRCLVIVQYTPEITTRLDLFTRAEWLTSIGFKDTHRFSTNLLRLGVQMRTWQWGVGSELLWVGSGFQLQNHNYGVFVTKVF